MTSKLISWNVNGLRAVIKKGFEAFVLEENPDIICLQEIKAMADQVDLVLPGYEAYWNSAEKKGYSGTAVFTRIKPLQVSTGLGISKHDKEGRVLTLEFEKAYLVNVYTPNSQNDLRRLPYRSKEWDRDFLSYVKSLELSKPVIFCGDLNVAHKEIDLANPKGNVGNAGFTPEERLGFDNIIAAGFVDTFRHFNQEPKNYSWWSYRTAARERNVGWRIDYFCVSSQLTPYLKSAAILPHVLGSDHCPVRLEVKDILRA
ncbi:MAG: exodeoxyribonuclease III [Proteobacteria bacterium]|nr:exodeoxyribonuclease III [Pseudomonadota bacterium]